MDPITLPAMAILASLMTTNTDSPKAEPPGRKMALVCFFSGERQAGMNKICYYNCAGSEAAITISAASLCPLSISR